jgi:hypothetical protein
MQCHKVKPSLAFPKSHYESEVHRRVDGGTTKLDFVFTRSGIIFTRKRIFQKEDKIKEFRRITVGFLKS